MACDLISKTYWVNDKMITVPNLLGWGILGSELMERTVILFFQFFYTSFNIYHWNMYHQLKMTNILYLWFYGLGIYEWKNNENAFSKKNL
jgi:hypothetical protein